MKPTFMKLTLTMVCFLFLATSWAQVSKISGKIISEEDGKPLSGVNITLKQKTGGTQTNSAGEFSIDASQGDVLVFSFTGYTEQQVTVGASSSISLTMKTESSKLGEVVVVGYGTQKKSSLTAPVVSISSKEIKKQITNDVSSTLQGRAPGVEIVSQSGIAGADVNILIRGVATFGSTDPLFIIDGAFSSSGLRLLNPNDIESIEVLKDGAAAAIYGSRAANGVVIVTTKAGKKGKPVIDFSASYSQQSPTKLLNYLNADQWRSFANQVSDSAHILRAPENVNPTHPGTNTDWQDLWIQPAPFYNASIGISGGGDYFTFNTSLSYLEQKGLTKFTDFKRYTFRINSSYKKNRLSIAQNISLGYRTKTPTPATRTIGLPTLPVDSAAVYYSGGPGYYIQGDRITNPLAAPAYTKNKINNLDLIGNLSMGYEIIKGLEYKLVLSGSMNGINNFSHSPQYYTRFLANGSGDPLYGNAVNSLSESRGTQFNYNIDNLLDYKKTIAKDHNLNILLGTSWLKEYYRINSISSITDLGGPGITGVGGGAATAGTVAASELNAALFSLFARANYDYKGKYLLSASIRRDESSKFPKNNRVGYFPSLSVGWNIDKENFFPQNDVLSRFKIRAGYGELGANFIDPYGFNDLSYGPVPGVLNNVRYTNGTVAYLANKDLKWETSISKNIGADLSFLKNALTLTVDYYIKTNKDILAPLQPAPSSGQTITINDGFQPSVNSATIRNKGLEILIGYDKQFSKDLKMNFSANITRGKNEVIRLGDNVQPLRGDLISGRFNDRPTITKEGLPVASFFGYRVTGIYNSGPKTGEFIFEDVNKNNLSDEGDKVVLGNPAPDFTYGMNISGTYKALDFTVFFQGVQGNEIFNQTKLNNYFDYSSNVVTDALQSWTIQNQNTSIPRVSVNNVTGGTRNALPSSFYIEDGSYLRLKNLQVGYTFKNVGKSFENLRPRIYGGIQNLFTITKYTGYDPEVSSNVLFNRGVDFNAYPNARSITLGVNLTF